MNQYKLVKEIIKTCKYFKIIENETDYNFIEKKIIDGLDDIIFVENLLNVFYRKTKSRKFKNAINKSRLKNILVELEKIRLNLEFKED